MELTRLELRGFKSFADKTVIEFSPGMTAIVGPNGSGKSNITDAIRWVLGESNVRNLRGQKAEDVIFSGTERRSPLQTAEVSLVFDNSDKSLPEQLATVVITRRMYRSGDSEFFINKRACRRKDIHMLLADTGLGRDSMAIIGQNKLDAILNSKAEERRLIFEDVAGISRFKLNKEEALRRMDATDRNVERLEDLMETLKQSLGDLEEKAEKTAEFNELNGKRHLCEASLAYHSFQEAQGQLEKAEGASRELRESMTRDEGELSTVESRLTEAQNQLDEVTEELDALKDKVVFASRRAERLQGQLAVLEEKKEAKRREQDGLKERQENLRAEHQSVNEALAALELEEAAQAKALDSAGDRLQSAEQLHAAGQAKLQNLRQDLANLEAAKDRAQSDRLASLEDKAQQEAQLSQLEARLAEGERDLGQAQQSLEPLRQKVIECQQALSAVEKDCANAKRTYEDKVQEANALRQALANAYKEQRVLEDGIQKAEGRLQILQQWEEQHEGLQEAAKQVLSAKAPWRRGIVGPLGELITVDGDYVKAIDTALGAAVNQIVTETSDSASQAIQYLKSQRLGRATFLPLQSLVVRTYDHGALKDKDVLGLATDFCHCESAVKPAVSYVLGRTLVVKDLATGLAVQKRHKQSLQLVTLDGDQLRPGGALTGGESKRKTISVLARKKEMAGLVEQIEAERDRLTTMRAQSEAQSADSEAVELAVRTANETLSALGRQLEASKARVQEAQALVARREGDVDQLASQLEEYRKDIDGLRASLAAFTIENNGEEVQEKIEAARRAIEAAQAAQDEAYERLVEHREGAKTTASRQEDLRAQRQRLTDRQSYLDEQLGRIGQDLQSLDSFFRVETVENEKILQAQCQEAEAEAKAGEDRQAVLQEARSAHGDALQEATERRRQLDESLRKAEQQLAKYEATIAAANIHLDQAVEKLDELQMTVEEAGSQAFPMADAKREISVVNKAIEALGPINPNAIEEFDEAKKKKDFYEQQLNDLDEAKSQLTLVIDELDAAMSSQLSDVLAVVSKRFQEVFSQLFGGGQAQIVCTTPDDLLHTGIDLLIQPPGKKRQQLSLLSGGERALTVIALLFSFLSYRPAPFCVLDEVDAALDEANVERFSRYLQSLGADTQFIVVSHRKKTMEAAQVLQGVTMVERGVSQLLTVNFDDIEEDA